MTVPSESHLLTIVDRFADATQLFGLTISLGKAEVRYQPAPGTTAPPPKGSIEGTELQIHGERHIF